MTDKHSLDAEELERIHQFTKSPLSAEELYVFPVRLCDNEVDRDLERFDRDALETLGSLFLGKSGIFDHQWSAHGQTARIYRTEVIEEPGRTTMAGDRYCWLKGWAYLLRTEKNQELITEIEGGIKKEVSVGCSVAERVCAVCGLPEGGCAHVKGEVYDGKLCYVELKHPTDAYEWSFVAVPAQREAGVVKRFGGDDRDTLLLRKQAALGRKYLQELRGEVVRLAMLADDELDGQVFSKAAAKLDEDELLELKRVYSVRTAKRFPVLPQLREPKSVQKQDETVFLV